MELNDKFGTSIKGMFIELTDRLLREKNDFISYKEITDKFMEEHPEVEIPTKPYSNNSLKQAKEAIRECLKKRGLDFEEKQGKKKTETLFKYPENTPDDLLSPLQMQEKTRKIRLKTLSELIQKSRGLLSSSCLAKFQLQAEEEINNIDTMPIIEFDANEQLRNLDLLPTLYYAIRDRQALRFTYCPYGKPERNLTFHPHYLKEYNLRWFVFGLAIDDNGQQHHPNICALDRIKGKIVVVETTEYIPSTIDYSTYFDDIVGVTHINGGKKKIIEIETKDYYTYMRILTKQLHKSQKIVQPWNSRNRTGRFSIEVIPNKELLGLLMSFENHIEIFGTYRKTFEREVNKIYNLYKNNLV